MSYIGKEPQYADFLSKFFNGDGTAMTVTLDASPPNEAALLVFIDGVRQDTSAYTVSGYSLTFTGVVPSGTNNVQVVHLGIAQDTQVPVDDSVSTAKIQDDAVTSAKLANSLNITSGNSLTIDSGATITNNGSQVGFGGVNTPIFMAGCYDATGYYTYSNNVNTKVAFNTELVDTDSAFDSSTNYRFTVPSGKGGKYYISAGVQIYNSGNITNAYVWLLKNSGILGWSRLGNSSTNGGYIEQLNVDRVFDLNAGDYLEVYVQLDGTGTNYLIVDNSVGYGRANWFCGWRLIT